MAGRLAAAGPVSPRSRHPSVASPLPHVPLSVPAVRHEC